MLAANGTLMLLATPSSRWLDLVFGATDRWWTSSDASHSAPFERSALHWQQCITALGFERKRTISLSPEMASSPYIIVARAPASQTVAQLQPQAAMPAWILLTDDRTADFAMQIGRAHV